jgi:hypothetical protein
MPAVTERKSYNMENNIAKLIATRTCPMLVTLDYCIEQLKRFEGDAEVDRAISWATIATDDERRCQRHEAR